ncbi:MAG: multicopper oxidase family protein [Bryobacterales bacterium]|nr:multicopper oxidase family protein [Bryobacterales bacterium]
MNRRKFLNSAVGGISAIGLAGCQDRRSIGEADRERSDYARRNVKQTGPTHEINITAATGEVEVGPGRIYKSWLYNGQFPGPEIRVREGDRLHIQVVNRLPAETTIHWHGIPVPNPMDGVAGLTQQPIAPGGSFTYDFVATPAGSYLYHSHVGLQLDRGLIAPLIVEEKNTHVSYDREYSVVLDDFLSGEPQPLGANSSGMGGMMPGRGMMCGMMGRQVPPYEGLLINGRLPDDPPAFRTKTGDRVRFRFLNPSGATTYRVAIGGHRMAITHTDGRPVRPFTVDSFYIGMGERYDVIVQCSNAGRWAIVAATVEGGSPPARALLDYVDAARSLPSSELTPEGLERGRVLELSDLESQEESAVSGENPDRTIDMVLSGGMMSPAWTINGQAYPDADLIEIREGEHVRVRMVNHSMMIHPMHLHGHFFQVQKVLKDTVIVPPHMGRASFDFKADNPGRWFFHCHNVYHMESGMAREFRYPG